jgi:hypothetical protein
MLLSSAPPALIPGGGTIQVESPPPQEPIIINIPPLPRELSSLASLLPPCEGVKTTVYPSAFIVTSRTWGHGTTPLCDVIVLPSNPTPMAVVNKFPSEFNLENTRSDEGVKDKTLSTIIQASSKDGGNPTTKVDPLRLTSIQAVMDNSCNDPNSITDPTLTCLWDFVSASSKVLDNGTHLFCLEQTKHDWRVDAIIQDLCADCIDPKSFVSTQNFDSQVQTMVQNAVDPSHAALCKELDAMKCPYDAILADFVITMTSGNTITLLHEQALPSTKLIWIRLLQTVMPFSQPLQDWEPLCPLTLRQLPQLMHPGSRL